MLNGTEWILKKQNGVSKAELYGTSNGELVIEGVRSATAEATVEADSNEFMMEEVIDLYKSVEGKDDFPSGTATSKMKHVLPSACLLKTIPARTKAKKI